MTRGLANKKSYVKISIKDERKPFEGRISVQWIVKFSIFIIILTSLYAQNIKTNPSTPLNRNAGYILELKEIMRIRDDSRIISFRGPYDLQIADDHSIYFYDSMQLYKYDNKGNFVFRIIRPGQGPGEASMRTSALITNDGITIQAKSPPKIMLFDLGGNLKDEKKIENTGCFDFVGFMGKNIYGFLEGSVPHGKDVREGYIDVPTWLWEITPDFQHQTKKFPFAIKYYVIKNGGAWWQRAELIFVLKKPSTLFVSHTSQYNVTKFDLERNRIELVFKREYKRVKYVPDKIELRRIPGVLSPPPPKYYADIAKLLIHDERLWVITSTANKDGSRLVDVYDMEGDYVDCFYLKFPAGISHKYFYSGNIVIKDQYLYSIDEHDDGTRSVAKYLVEF